MGEPPETTPPGATVGGHTRERQPAASSTRDPPPQAAELLQAIVLALALVGYVYAIGWVLTCVRLAAVRLSIGAALPAIGSDAILATGARAVLVMTLVFAAMCAVAYAVYWRRWERHAETWRAIVQQDRATVRSERYLRTSGLKRRPPRPVRARAGSAGQEIMIRVIAGFNVGVLAVAAGLVVGRFAKTLIDQWQPGHHWALLVPWALASVLAAWVLAHVNPLKGGRVAHAILWLSVLAVAMLSSAPVGLLVLTWMGIATFGRWYGKRPLPGSPLELARSSLPWVLLTIFGLVAVCYSAMPPASFPQTTVQTTEGGMRLGGYIGRTTAGVYVVSCTPLADATSTNDRVQFISAALIDSIATGDTDYRLDTGYRPSLPTLVLRAFGIDTQTIAWIRPEFTERRAPCADAPPPRPSIGVPAPRLGVGVFASPTPPNGGAVSKPIEQDPPLLRLAKRFQPTVLVSVTDPFWPVSVQAALQDVGADGRSTCVHRNGVEGRCALGVHATLADLQPRSSTPQDFLEYPVTPALTRGPMRQFEAFLRGQRGRQSPLPTLHQWLSDPGMSDPWATAQVYFYYAGAAHPDGWPSKPPAKIEDGLVGLQYWFFYPYNYYPTLVTPDLMNDAPLAGDVVNTDLHQGDWEHVTVLVDPRTEEARWLYTARHSSEGAYLPWDSPLLAREGDHPIVQAAYGGHPSYPAGCGERRRYIKPLDGHASDWLVCGPGRFAFQSSTTPLVDLARTPWACWRGRFGVTSPKWLKAAARRSAIAREAEKYVLVPGPRSPLWQAENGHLEADDEPGEHRPDSGPCLARGGPLATELQAVRRRIGLRARRRTSSAGA